MTNQVKQFYRARSTTSGQILFSTNVVGYVNLSIRPGYNLLSNPLSVGLTNGANEIMPPIDGEQILTWSGSGFDYVSYDSGFGGWVDMNFNPSVPPSLPPGKGFFLFNPDYVATQTFVGEVTPAPCTTNTIPLPSGYSLVGSPLPADVYPIEAAPVSLPLIEGMQNLWWQGLDYDFDTWDSGFGGWVGCGFLPTKPPGYSVGQGFFFYNPGPAAGWSEALPCF